MRLKRVPRRSRSGAGRGLSMRFAVVLPLALSCVWIAPGTPVRADEGFPPRQGTPPASFDKTLLQRLAVNAATADQLAAAMDIPAANIVSVSIGTTDATAVGVSDSGLGNYFPNHGSTFAILATGAAATAATEDDSESTSGTLSGLDTQTGHDLAQLTIELTRPADATCLAFDFAFYSEEFDEYVGSSFNDAFIAEIGESNFQEVDNQVVAPNNFAFDTGGNVISVNTVFGVSGGTNTTYDGATPLLTAQTPFEGEIQTNVILTFSIMDLGDSIYDSAVFLDNFRWLYGADCVAGVIQDTDGDALEDDWETNGIDVDDDGTIDLDLPAMGADPNHKDIFLEIDYMVMEGAGGHSHKPKAAALTLVIDAFRNAPVANPDGTTGINLHIDAGSDTVMNPVTGELWGARSESNALAHTEDLGTFAGGSYNWSAFDAIKGVGTPGNFSILRGDAFHYCIFAHDLGGLGSTSGISRDLPASDFIVSLGSWTGNVGTVNQQGGTLMHEFGHNLSLRHGGDDHANYEPNYLSIMNYSFQTRGLRIGGTDGHFDYSRFVLPALNESTLNETVGLSGVAEAAGYGTRYYCPGGAATIVNDINGGIDWNCDTDSADNPVNVDINNSGGSGTLNGSDNWDEIVFNGGAIGKLGQDVDLPDTTEAVDEITEEEDAMLPTQYAVSITGPGEVSVSPGGSQTYDYTITNTGDEDDSYTITSSSTQSWADFSGLPSTLDLASGASQMFQVPVSVPAGTSNGTQDTLEIVATSAANTQIRDTIETVTVAGEAGPDNQNDNGTPTNDNVTNDNVSNDNVTNDNVSNANQANDNTTPPVTRSGGGKRGGLCGSGMIGIVPFVLLTLGWLRFGPGRNRRSARGSSK